MADQLTLEVATPSRLVIGEQVDEVVVPGIEGYFGVLPGHAPLLSTVGIGELTYRIGRDERHSAVSGGFCEVRNDKVIVLADSAERSEEHTYELQSHLNLVCRPPLELQKSLVVMANAQRDQPTQIWNNHRPN